MRQKIAFVLLRTGLGAVFLVFGIGKFQHDYWARTIESMDFFQQLPWGVEYSVLAVGVLEVLTGTCLILGLFTRIIALIAAAQLFMILYLLQFQEIRDIGLLAAALYVAASADTSLGLDRFLNKRS
ncbi:DoxX family protein [Candidatus Omnitrophota bacterium]